MASKNDTEVVIGGRVLRLGGYESEEYLQRVASYINSKIAELNRVDSYHKSQADTQNLLLQLNITDDYFKAKKQISLLEEEIQAKEKELYDLKHELIASQIKLENSEKSGKKLKDELDNTNKKLIRLEAEKNLS